MGQTASYKNDTQTTRKDLYQQITDTIIAQLEKGTVPWRQPWNNGAEPLSIPKNYISDKPYRGINIPLLWITAQVKQFRSSEWATFKQWRENGETICKGAKGTMIVFYKLMERENKDGQVENIPFLKSSVVFNRCQLTSYDPEKHAQPPAPRQSLVQMQEQAEAFIKNFGVPIHHSDYGAFYLPGSDEIHLPYPFDFVDTNLHTATEAYYSTLFHEVIHATGHPKRLNREMNTDSRSPAYAKEELTAELGAAFLCSELDICKQPREEHASYIASWLTLLKNNKYAITKAAGAASKAVDFLKALQPEHQPA